MPARRMPACREPAHNTRTRETEFGFSLITVVAIVALIVPGGVAVFGFTPLSPEQPGAVLRSALRRVLPPLLLVALRPAASGVLRATRGMGATMSTWTPRR